MKNGNCEPSLDAERTCIGFRKCPIDGETRLTGIIGDDTSHSLTPYIFSDVFERLNLNLDYLCFNVKAEELQAAVTGMRALNVRAFYITMPYKRDVLSMLDEVDPQAAAIGAVNTVVNENGRLKGYNLDKPGFMYPLRDDELSGKRVLFLGSGGAGAACAFGLVERGVHMTILSRTHENARKLADRLSEHFGCVVEHGPMTEERVRAEIKDAFMVVNSTNLGYGAASDLSPVPADALRSDLIVYDIVNAGTTPLIRDAQALGCRTHDGNDMLACNTKSFLEFLTGRMFPDEVIDISRDAGRKAMAHTLKKN